MIGSRTGSIVAGVVALALLVIVVWDLRRDEAPASRELVPGVVVERVHELAWPERGVVIRRGAKGWAWEKPAGPADARTVDDVLAALRGARWHRRESARFAGPPHGRIVIDGATTIAFGKALEGGEQRWILLAGSAYLVDSWVVRALDPEPLALRVRVPFANPAGAKEIRGGSVVVRGTPRELVEPVRLVLAPAVSEPLERALGELEVVVLPTTPVRVGAMRVVVDGVEVVGGEAGCGEAITGTFGGGCVRRAAWEAVVRAFEALRGPPSQLADPRPLPFQAARIVLADKAVLELAKGLRVGDHDADPAHVTELLAVLAAPAEIIAPPVTRRVGEIVATDGGGTAHAIDLYGGGVIARRGEPVALRLGQGAYELLVRPSGALRDPTVWLEEPTTIASITIDGTSFARGATIGEWTRSGPGRDEPALVEQLVTQLAMLRGRGAAPAGVAKRHDVTLEVVPPTGTDKHTRTLTLGTAAGACVGNGEFLLAREICQTADRLVAQ